MQWKQKTMLAKKWYQWTMIICCLSWIKISSLLQSFWGSLSLFSTYMNRCCWLGINNFDFSKQNYGDTYTDGMIKIHQNVNF